MWIYVLLGIAALIAILVVFVATRPADFRVERSATITASPAIVFEQVNDFHNWGAWSPWEKLDPAMKKTHEGAPSGVGAIYSWSGNSKVGQGRMTIMESRPSELIRIRLEFMKPFKCTNTAEFLFNPQGDQTQVVWSMSGKQNFMSKLFGLIMNMDKMIGKDFEKGLAQLKAVGESGR